MGGEDLVDAYFLYYYDRPLLASCLSHYCQLDVVREIIIQDQNWSTEDTLYLLKTVARYIDEYGKKIVVLPSQYPRVEGANKREQFLRHDQQRIRNRVTNFLQDKTFICGAMDEAIYGESYADTNEKLRAFEELAEERVQQGKNTVGFLPLYCVYRDGFFPCGGIPIRRITAPSWRHRIFRFVKPFRRAGGRIHEGIYQIFAKGKWRSVTPGSQYPSKERILANPAGVPLGLRLLHYHTLVRPSLDSVKFIEVSEDEIQHPEQHPYNYLHKLVIEPCR